MWFGDPTGHIITALWYSDKHLTGYKSLQCISSSLQQMEEIHCKLYTAHQVLLSHTVWHKTFPAASGKKAKYLALTYAQLWISGILCIHGIWLYDNFKQPLRWNSCAITKASNSWISKPELLASWPTLLSSFVINGKKQILPRGSSA